MEIRSSADYVRMTREALAAAGFVRTEIDGTVYWNSEAAGSQPAVVLLHGVNDQAGSWFTIAPALAHAHRVILPDLPGHGESEPREGPIPISMMIASLRKILGDQRVTLAGNSLGGWIAMLYALAYPRSVERLVLEASGGLARPFASPIVARDRDEALLILRNVHGPRYQAPEWVIGALLSRAKDSPMLRMTELAEHAIDARLGDLRMPTTIIWGADDGVLPLSYANDLQRGIASASLHVIEGAAHIPHLQQPERFLACLTSTS